MKSESSSFQTGLGIRLYRVRNYNRNYHPSREQWMGRKFSY